MQAASSLMFDAIAWQRRVSAHARTHSMDATSSEIERQSPRMKKFAILSPAAF
jgi:hypothetical protein